MWERLSDRIFLGRGSPFFNRSFGCGSLCLFYFLFIICLFLSIWFFEYGSLFNRSFGYGSFCLLGILSMGVCLLGLLGMPVFVYKVFWVWESFVYRVEYGSLCLKGPSGRQFYQVFRVWDSLSNRSFAYTTTCPLGISGI